MATPRLRNRDLWIIAGAVLIFLWTAWWYRNGEASYLRIHDGLNSTVAIQHVVSRPPWLLAGSESRFEPLANFPRHCMYSEFVGGIWLYRFLPALWAYALGEVVFRMFAYAGAWLLVHHYLWPVKNSADTATRTFYITGLALCFAALAFWIPGQLNTMGHPIVLWALLNLRFRRHVAPSWAVLAIYPFFSNPVLTGVFVLAILAVGIIVDAIATRRVAWSLVAAGIMLAILWCSTQYRLFEARWFDSDFVSIRSEFATTEDIIAGRSAKHSYDDELANWEWAHSFFSGEDPHAPARQTPFVFAAIGLATVMGLARCFQSQTPELVEQTRLLNEQAEGRTRYRGNGRRLVRSLSLLTPMLAAVLICAATTWWLGRYRYPFFGLLIGSLKFGLLNELNLARINWFQPLLWFTAFVFAVRIISHKSWCGAAVCVALIACQLGLLTYSSEHNEERRRSGLTFREYYSPDVFTRIKNEIGRDQSTYRVGAVGFEPIISLYNGFYTVDGLHSNYDLNYKHRFRKVIAGELAKDAALKNQFDTFGAEFYLFSAQLESASPQDRSSGSTRLYLKDDAIRRIDSFDIDLKAFRALGGEYLLSAVEIGNADELGLKDRGVFSSADSPWEIRLYEVP